jgi:hypothetical protein
VSEADTTGKKWRTFVIAAGAEIARQAVLENDDEAVTLVHTDPSGVSTFSMSIGTGFAHDTQAMKTEELDGLGNNVGTFGSMSRPPYSGGVMDSPADAVTMDDVTMGDCSLDGMIVPCSMVLRAAQSGAIDFRFGFMTYQFANDYGISVVFNPVSGRDAPADTSGVDKNGVHTVQTYQDAGRWEFIVNVRPVSWLVSQDAEGGQGVVDETIRFVERILQGNNSCSRWFGKGAATVLSVLASKLKVANVADASASLGIRMRLPLSATQVTSDYLRKYISPINAQVHSGGLFFFDVANLGPFSSNSLEGRAVQILHELAHLLFSTKNPNVHLLPWHSDGPPRDSTRSKLNTFLILGVCRKAIEDQAIQDYLWSQQEDFMDFGGTDFP